MSANQYSVPTLIGWIPIVYSIVPSTFALSGAASGGFSQSWLAYGFVPDQSKSITEISAYISAVTGTLATTDLQCDIFSDSSGSPGSSLVSSISSGGSAPTANTWRRWAFSATALTAGTQYWILIRNANGSPTANFATFRYSSISGSPVFSATQVAASSYGPYVKTTLTGAAPWTTSSSGGIGWRIGYSDGTYAGLPSQNFATGSGATQTIWQASGSQNQAGIRFTTPANATLNVRGVATVIFKNGAPAGGIKYNLWTGASTSSPTLAGTTYTIPNAIITESSFRAWAPAYFSSPIAIPGGTVVRVTAADDDPGQTDSSTNSFSTFQFTMDSDANSTPLLPYEGTWQGTVYNGTTFTDQGSTPIIVPFALILDTGGEFASVGGNTYTRSRVVSGV